MASVYGYTGPTVSQKKEHSDVVEDIVAEFRCRGRGPCLVCGDFNVESAELAVFELLARAGWADWCLDPTCVTANSRQSRRIDQVWLSGEMQARLTQTRVDWVSGLCTHALQEGVFEEGQPGSFDSWQLGDSGPEEGEPGFSDGDFWEDFAGSWDAWSAASASNDVDAMWSHLEASLCRCHRLLCSHFVRPEARTTTKFEEPRRDGHQGDLEERTLLAATLRKRRVQQWLSWQLKPETEERTRQLKNLRQALAGDSDPEWAAVAMLSLPQMALEELVKKAREEEDKVRAELRAKRRAGFFGWCRAESTGNMRALYRWVREGPRSMQSTGIFVKDGRLFAGQSALLLASELAWWPLWQQDQGPCWARVVPPRAAPGWAVRRFEAEDLRRVVLAMSCSKAPGHDG
jgi:hypothetical protein